MTTIAALAVPPPTSPTAPTVPALVQPPDEFGRQQQEQLRVRLPQSEKSVRDPRRTPNPTTAKRGRRNSKAKQADVVTGQKSSRFRAIRRPSLPRMHSPRPPAFSLPRFSASDPNPAPRPTPLNAVSPPTKQRPLGPTPSLAPPRPSNSEPSDVSTKYLLGPHLCRDHKLCYVAGHPRLPRQRGT